METKEKVVELLGQLEVTEPQIVGNIAMVGLIDKKAIEQSPVLSLTRAIRMNQIQIQEAGSYNELEFDPENPVLLRSSEGVIKGGMQDRIVKHSRVLDGKEILDVYCIEQGRWSSEKGSWTPVNLPVPIRRAVMKGEPQDRLWEMIQKYLGKWGVETRTQALGAIYDALGPKFEKFVANFEWWKDQVGMIVVINGVASGMEYFGGKTDFRMDGMALLRESYVPEALRGQKRPMMPMDVTRATSKFLDELNVGKRQTSFVPYDGQVVYANAI